MSAPKAMPRVLRPYEMLWNDVAHLHLRWRMFVTLYATEQATIDLLNAAAPHFFTNLQRTLSDDIYGRISSLLDPGSRGRDNLCLEALLNGLLSHVDADLIVSLTDGLATLRSQAAPVRTWRNKVVAHRDREAVVSKTMPAIERKPLDDILDGIAGFMNEVAVRFKGVSTGYGYIDAVGEDLIAALRKAVKLDEMFRESEGRRC